MKPKNAALIFVLSLLAIVSSRAQAQSPPSEPMPGKFVLGAQAGPVLSWYAGADADTETVETSRAFGFFAGAFARYDVSSWIAMRSALVFIRKGAEVEILATGTLGEDRLSYLEIPLLVELTFFEHHHVSTYLSAGPALSFAIGCTAKTGDDVGDCKDTKPALDVGLLLGLGVSVALPWRGALSLDVLYDASLVSNTNIDPDFDVKNRAVLFSIGYSHRLGGADPR